MKKFNGNNSSHSNLSSLSKQLKYSGEKDFISQSELILDHKVASNTQNINSFKFIHNCKHMSFLPTAKVLLYNNEGKSFLFPALLDSRSECSFISENVVNILGIKQKNDRLCLSGIAKVSAGITRESIYLKIGTIFSKEFNFINA